MTNTTALPRSLYAAIMALVLAAGLHLLTPSTAAAACCNCCTCGAISSMHSSTRKDINKHITKEFKKHRKEYWMEYFWPELVLPALMDMTEQLTQVGYHQMQIIGGYFDAQTQTQAQRSLQGGMAKAHKNYTPSVSLCTFGSVTKSLASAQAMARSNHFNIGSHLMQRQLGQSGRSSAEGPASDYRARSRQFISKFCDPHDNNDGLADMCGAGGSDTEINADIDFTRTLGSQMTVPVNFQGGGASNNTLTALASNIYASQVFANVPASRLQTETQQANYLDLRSVAAKRSVALNSFAAYAGMKSEGGAASADYLKGSLRNLGLSPEDATKYLGENPSYWAQMEVLTKKLYQDPAFYANLMDKPANVKRTQASLMAYELMQQRDIFESLLRTEMLYSQLLELKVRDRQKDVEDKLGPLRNTGRKL